MTPDTKREVARKILHMSMGGFAFALRWLTPLQAALCALAALAHNLWIFPLYGREKLERPEEKARGYSGMIGYPAVVLVIILLSATPADLFLPLGGTPWKLGLASAAAAWAVLAFGDAAAALAGIFLGGPRLPWNHGKRWSGWIAFTAVGASTGVLLHRFVAAGAEGAPTASALWGIALLAASVAGLVESMPGQIDDNLSVPLTAWLVFSFADTQGLAHLAGAWSARFSPEEAAGLHLTLGLLLVNAAFGLSALALKWVSRASCALGILFGCAVIVGTGWLGYALLLLFYLVSQLSTFFGKRVKERRGIAEPDEGRRRTGSVFSKGLMPALFSLFSPLAFVASLALYAADTVASEVGKTSKRPPHLLFRRKPVEPGTVGALSRRGTLAGYAVILAFLLAASFLSHFGGGSFFLADDHRVFAGTGTFSTVGPLDLAILMLGAFFACVAAFLGESLLNEKMVARGHLSKELGHLFVGGLAGALTFGAASAIATLLQILLTP